MVVGAVRAVIYAVLAGAVDAAFKASQFTQQGCVIWEGYRAAIEVGHGF